MTEKGFWEFLNAALAKGRIPMVSGYIDSNNTIIQAGSEFLSGHALLPEGYENIPVARIVEMGKLLLKDGVRLRTKEAVMIILAHHGCDEALSALKRYSENPEPELRIFAEFALDECEMWNEE